MSRNVYFSQGVQSEKNLYEDIIIESIKIYGHEVFYMPRKIIQVDEILNEDVASRFDSAFNIEMYVENVDGYEGDGILMSKFGLEIRNQMKLVVSRKRWDASVGVWNAGYNNFRPSEGDLIYMPSVKGVFEIKFVELETPFYQLQNLPVYKITCELFEYSNEDIDTGVAEVDNLQILKTQDQTTYRSTFTYQDVRAAMVTAGTATYLQVSDITGIYAGMAITSYAGAHPVILTTIKQIDIPNQSTGYYRVQFADQSDIQDITAIPQLGQMCGFSYGVLSPLRTGAAGDPIWVTELPEDNTFANPKNQPTLRLATVEGLSVGMRVSDLSAVSSSLGGAYISIGTRILKIHTEKKFIGFTTRNPTVCSNGDGRHGGAEVRYSYTSVSAGPGIAIFYSNPWGFNNGGLQGYGTFCSPTLVDTIGTHTTGTTIGFTANAYNVWPAGSAISGTGIPSGATVSTASTASSTSLTLAGSMTLTSDYLTGNNTVTVINPNTVRLSVNVANWSVEEPVISTKIITLSNNLLSNVPYNTKITFTTGFVIGETVNLSYPITASLLYPAGLNTVGNAEVLDIVEVTSIPGLTSLKPAAIVLAIASSPHLLRSNVSTSTRVTIKTPGPTSAAVAKAFPIAVGMILSGITYNRHDNSLATVQAIKAGSIITRIESISTTVTTVVISRSLNADIYDDCVTPTIITISPGLDNTILTLGTITFNDGIIHPLQAGVIVTSLRNSNTVSAKLVDVITLVDDEDIHDGDIQSQNSVLEIKSNDYLDFSEINPFGEPNDG